MLYAAIDLGALSGRVVVGRFDGERISLEELHRFTNRPVRLPDGLRWNLLHLFEEGLSALRGLTLQGVGVDTWGVFKGWQKLSNYALPPQTAITLMPCDSRNSTSARIQSRRRCPQA